MQPRISRLRCAPLGMTGQDYGSPGSLARMTGQDYGSPGNSDSSQFFVYRIALICASTCERAASNADRREGFEVRCERMFSRCRFNACIWRRFAALLCSASRRASSFTMPSPACTTVRSPALAICSSTDLLSQPRAISSFYGEFSVVRLSHRLSCSPQLAGGTHAYLADSVVRY